MPTKNAAQASPKAAGTKRFSLVSELAQQRMYAALAALKPAQPDSASGAEVAEIAVCVALDENDPVILASPAVGARTARKGLKAVKSKDAGINSATLQAITGLLSNPKATALICLGRLDCQSDTQQDYRNAFSFAARHKLPILFLMANALTPGRPQKLDLRSLYAEFGIPVFSVAANDAIAVYRVATEALHNARYHRGPCIIEALTVLDKNGSPANPLHLLRDYMERHGNWPL